MHFIKPLHSIASILALKPPRSRDKNCCFTYYRFYSMVLIVFLISLFIYSTYQQIPLFNTVEPSGITLYLIMELILLLAACSSIFRSFLNTEKFNLLEKLFCEIDLVSEKNCQLLNGCNAFYIEIIVTHIVAVMFVCYDIFISIECLTLEIFLYHVVKEIIEYYNFIGVLLIYNYVLCLKFRFKRITNSLITNTDNYMNCSKYRFSKYCEEMVNNIDKAAVRDRKYNILTEFKELRRTFDKAVTIGEILNNIFGWQMLFLWLIAVVELVMTVNISLVYVKLDHSVYFAKADCKCYVLVYSVLWCSVMLVSTVC